jgi:hypothetical protein
MGLVLFQFLEFYDQIGRSIWKIKKEEEEDLRPIPEAEIARV